MRLSVVPVLLLATVAISSSNVLPMLSLNQLETEPIGLDSQQNDNILSNKHHRRSILNDIFYTISIAMPQNGRRQQQYVNHDNNIPEEKSNIVNKEDTYNGEGYRQEQWHNYPRQLDRLHNYLYDHHSVDKRNPDPDDPNDYTDNIPQTSPDNEIRTNEYHKTNNDDNSYETVVAATNPFLILKIRLACIKDKLRNTNTYTDITSSEPEYIPGNRDQRQLYKDIINPEVTVTKLKREEVNELQDNSIPVNSVTKNRAVKKRIFSLWSRLQGFNHKGHELQHRRHLHAFYGLPDADGGGVLTAETRATFLRPPGSPLRWG